MKPTAFLLVSLLILFSCKEKKSDIIIIEGNVKGIPAGKIYLTQAHLWNIPIDSTECINGHFIFKIIPDSSFTPFMAAIHFPDSEHINKNWSLIYRNYMLGSDSMKYAGDGFFLEKGYTRIEGDNKAKPYLRVFAGKETEIMYRNQFSAFGWLGNIDAGTRSLRIESFKKQINENPFSYYLMQSIYENKEQYSKKEMKGIVGLFNEDLQKSNLGRKITTYLVNRPDPNMPNPNLYLINNLNQRSYILNDAAKLNMLVFWASWCGPCRMEIPLLKEIHSKYKSKDMSISSISIDKNRSDWDKAVKQENMPWIQFLVDNDKIEEVRQQYNFTAIPLVVFTDKAGNELARFVGLDAGNKAKYESLILQYIK
jgi:thiol-disulfide isomerase/thioredoxin